MTTCGAPGSSGHAGGRYSRVRSVVLCCCSVLTTLTAGMAAEDGGPARNAIFNGDFLEGTAGWKVGGPPGLQVKTQRNMIADRADAELSLRHDDLTGSMGIYSQYPIKVEPGRAYTLTLTAAGKGSIAFGAYEYSDRGKNTVFPLSPRMALTTEPRTYTFAYTASANGATIRPRAVVFGREKGGASASHARLLKLQLLLPAAEFARRTDWPDWAVSGEHRNYKGFSDEQIQQITRAVAVDGILPPYEPIRAESDGVYRLTTSRFRFRDSVLPDHIAVLSESILNAPLRLDLQVADGQPVDFAQSAPTFAADEQRVVVRQTVAGDGWKLALTGTLEYDALLIVDVVMHPERPTRIDRASLSIPITDRVARYIRYQRTTPDTPYCFGEGPIPARGQTVETRLTLGRAQLKNDWAPRRLDEPTGTLWQWTRGVPHFFWIGDEQKGLAFLADRDQGWHFGEGDVTWSLERTAEGLTAHLNVVTKPTTVTETEPWKLRFILQAMPPKPVRSDWFKLRFNRMWNWQPGDRKMIERIEAMRNKPPQPLAALPPAHVRYAQAGSGERTMRPPWQCIPSRARGWNDIGMLSWGVWSVGCSSPQVAEPEWMRRYLEAGAYVGFMGLPYFAPTHLSVNDLNAYHYAARTDEWARLPQTGNTSRYVKVCPNSFSSEYLAYEIGRLIDEYGIDGVYFDNTAVRGCSNRDHGCGWVGADGKTHPTRPFLAVRRLMMMVCHQFLQRGKRGFIMKHAGMLPGTISFTDANLDGEGIYGHDHTQLFTTGEFRARYIGPNQFGVIEVYLPQLHYARGAAADSDLSSGERVRRGTPPLLALTLVHGTPVYCGAINFPAVAKAWSVLDRLRGPTVDFIGYWDWPWTDTLRDRDIYASIYRQPSVSVLVVSNLSAQNTGIAIPRSELNELVPGLKTARDDMNNWRVDLDADSLRLSVPAKSFRLITLE